MPKYRRNFQQGGTYFFTVVTDSRARILCSDLARSCLRQAVKSCQKRWPFESLAWVLLDDHLHSIWALPEGDDAYSLRWSWIKKEFTKAYLAAGGKEQSISASKRLRRERGVWQRRFWEHTLKDDRDLARHMDYIHYNPVKHKLVSCPKDYPYSSFHRWVKAGVYEQNWACLEGLDFADLVGTVGE